MICDEVEGWVRGGRLHREGTYVYVGLVHVVLKQKLTQHHKAIILLFFFPKVGLEPLSSCFIANLCWSVLYLSDFFLEYEFSQYVVDVSASLLLLYQGIDFWTSPTSHTPHIWTIRISRGVTLETAFLTRSQSDSRGNKVWEVLPQILSVNWPYFLLHKWFCLSPTNFFP